MKPKPVANPPNPWASTVVEWLEEPPEQRLEVFEEEGKSIVSENDSPDVPMRFSVNAYRGCVHACAYCYARPSHQYLGFGAGTDFDRKIVVKTNAPELLRATFDKKSWQGDSITFSGNTDCYQPLEGSYQLTRRCLEICLDYRNPLHVITKSALIRRDAELLAKLAREVSASVTLSIPFSDDAMGRAIEPYASAPSARFETVRRLVEAGVPTSVNIAPVIPGLNDSQIGEILERAKHAGARGAACMPVRLAAEVLPVFFERLAQAFPGRVKKVESALLQIRRGKLNDSEFGKRMTGDGPRWQAI
ncbi:MAG: radical SAM protein, partial [Polyangiales bacterium]